MPQLPKVELHLHLDCSLSYEAVSRLATHISGTEYDTEFVAPSQCASLADFLTRARLLAQIQSSKHSMPASMQPTRIHGSSEMREGE
jgi:adenosine deaminase